MNAASKAARALARARWDNPKADRDQPREAGKLGGRPKILVKCERCGVTGGTAEMRRHKCGGKTK